MIPMSDGAPRRIYLAGPMQGYPAFNFPRFHAIAAILRLSGHEVFSPAEKDIERHATDISVGNPTGSLAVVKEKHGFSLRQALYEDLTYITLTANCVVMLPGWERSNGSQSEQRTAVALYSEGMEIVYLTEQQCVTMENVHALREAAKEGMAHVA